MEDQNESKRLRNFGLSVLFIIITFVLICGAIYALKRLPCIHDALNRENRILPVPTLRRRRPAKRREKEALMAAISAQCRVDQADIDWDEVKPECSICLDNMTMPNLAGETGKGKIEKAGKALDCDVEAGVAERDSGESLGLVKLPCQHVFHEDCLVGGWIVRGSGDSCPLCNYDLTQLVTEGRKGRHAVNDEGGGTAGDRASTVAAEIGTAPGSDDLPST